MTTTTPIVCDLKDKNCVPCEGGMPPLTQAEIDKLKPELKTNWLITSNQKLEQQFEFKDFKQAMEFVNKVAKIAEAEGHHPDIYIFYNKVRIELSTHAIGGLSENDFILASKIELVV